MWDKEKQFFIGLLSLIAVGLCFPSDLYSQTTDFSLAADKILIDEYGVLTASGNVVIRYGSRVIRAKSLVYNKNDDHLKIAEIKEFIDSNKIKISANSAELNSSLNKGTLSLVKVLLDEQIKIDAGNIEYKDGTLSKVSEITRITSCNECEEKAPQWHFTASSASRDLQNLNVIYRDVTVRVKDFPIAYIPYLRLPDPTVERAQGFLTPIIALTSNLGVGTKLPYFIPIGGSRDILVTPLVSSNSRTVEYRYRQVFRNGSLRIDGAVSSDTLSEKKIRSFYRAQGGFQLPYDIQLGYDIGQSSEKSYLNDYGFNATEDFDSEIDLEKIIVNKNRLFNGQIKFKDNEDDISTSQRYVSILGNFSQVLKQNIVPGNLRLGANLNSSMNFDYENGFSRPPSSAQVSLNYNQFRILGPFSLSKSGFVELSSFVNSEDNGSTDEESTVRYGATLYLGIPLHQNSTSLKQILTPKVQISISDQTDIINGDAFIGLDELTFANLFSSKKVTSLSESELGATLSFGVDYYSELKNGRTLELSFGALSIDRLTYNSASTKGLPGEDLNYISGFKYKASEFHNFLGNSFFSQNGKLMNANLKSTYSWGKFQTKTGYEFVNTNFDGRLNVDIDNLHFLSEYNFYRSSHININIRHDLTQSKTADLAYGVGTELGFWKYTFEQKFSAGKNDKMTLSAVYDDECTRFTMSFQNQYKDIAGFEPIRTLAFRVQFKPFANVKFSRDSINDISYSEF